MNHFIGCHLSSSNIFKSIDEVNKYGGNFIQIFVTNPMGRASVDSLKKYKEIGPDIKQYCENNLSKIVVHSPYVLNFAKSFNEESYEIKRILLELRIAHEIGAIGCVIHVGKSLDLDINKATLNMFLSIKYILDIIRKEKLNTILILETAAGQGTELFVTEENTLDDLANFYHRFTKEDKKIFKLCVDTCHIFSGGFDIGSKKKVRYFFILFDKMIGLEYLALIHFNDSKTEYNSHKDRHEKIGKGHIALSGLAEFARQANRFKIPLCLETHGEAYTKEIPWILKIINKVKNL
jgi:deoxyribonuclease-4